MKRPDVELDNYQAVYDYYENHDQNKAFARFAHKALGAVYRPKISMDDNVEDVLNEEIKSGSRIVVAPNHITSDDQYLVVSIAEKIKSLHPLRGNTFIPSEPSLFTRPGIKGKLLRNAVDELGAIPTFRLEDLRRKNVEVTEDIKETHRLSMLKASQTQESKLIRGSHMAGFLEGTRNRVNHQEVQPFKKGMGHTILKASEQANVLILPVGMYYGGEPDDYIKPKVPSKYQPTVHLGTPINVKDFKDVDEMIAAVHPVMQKCVDEAVYRTDK